MALNIAGMTTKELVAASILLCPANDKKIIKTQDPKGHG